MAQPDYVPLVPADRIRPSSRLSNPGHWEQTRPAELTSLRPPTGATLGATGPDLGFGLKLAKRVAERAELGPGDLLADAIAGCFACGTLRSSHFHRAPVVYDMEWAFTLWGFLADAPQDLVAYRRPLFAGADHDYSRRRAIVDKVPEHVLALTPAELKGRIQDWQKWLVAPTAPVWDQLPTV